jgi:hypothetical protein
MIEYAKVWDGLSHSGRFALLRMITEVHGAVKFDECTWDGLPTDVCAVLMKFDWEFALGRLLGEEARQ